MFKIRKNNLTNELGAVDARKTYDENAPITLDYPTVHIISGAKGSGKTSQLISMLRSKNIYKRRFNNIFLISPTAGSGADPKMLKLVEELESSKYSKGNDTWPHFVTMVFRHFSKLNSLNDFCYGMRSAIGDLNHLGVTKL